MLTNGRRGSLFLRSKAQRASRIGMTSVALYGNVIRKGVFPGLFDSCGRAWRVVGHDDGTYGQLFE